MGIGMRHQLIGFLGGGIQGRPDGRLESSVENGILRLEGRKTELEEAYVCFTLV